MMRAGASLTENRFFNNCGGKLFAKTGPILLDSNSMLAALEKPVGIYFVSENIFTLASYYQHDNHDREFFPSGDWEVLPEDEAEELPLLMGGVEDA